MEKNMHFIILSSIYAHQNANSIFFAIFLIGWRAYMKWKSCENMNNKYNQKFQQLLDKKNENDSVCIFTLDRLKNDLTRFFWRCQYYCTSDFFTEILLPPTTFYRDIQTFQNSIPICACLNFEVRFSFEFSKHIVNP